MLGAQGLLPGRAAETPLLAGLRAKVCACIFEEDISQMMFPEEALQPLQISFKTFYFEMIIDPEELAEIGQRGPVYPSPSFPHGYILHN